MATSLKDLFGVDKPVIGMVHLLPLPGTPLYDESKGISGIIEAVYQDVLALQQGGVDAVLFGNEGDRPYRICAGPETVAVITRVITEMRSKLSVPFGVDVLWDPKASIAVAKATGACFVREVFTNVYAGDLGLWITNCAEVLRYRRLIDAENVKLFFNINAEFVAPLAPRPLFTVVKSVIFSSLPDAICISGPMTGQEANLSDLREAKESAGDIPVVANTGVKLDNVEAILEIADGCIVGTAFKCEGITWNPVDVRRVQSFMDKVISIRSIST